MENKQYNSNNITLKDIVQKGIQFNIPIYQRLYVWKELQVNKLLEDLFAAYRKNETHYYLGGVVTYSNGNKQDLIDGQQRFTTLWLICMVLSSMNDSVCEEMKRFCGNKENLRIHFAIRPQISEYLIKMLENEDIDNSEISSISDIKNMTSAIGNIETFCEADEHRDCLAGFSEFIMNCVVLVRTEIPEDTDLNKLFELINGRGQQLSQTDILKSHILDLIREETEKDEDQLIRYGQIWNACADMNDFVEHNIQQEDPSLTWKDRLIFDRESDNEDEGVIAEFGNDFIDKYILLPVKDNYDNQSESLLQIVQRAITDNDSLDNIDDNSSNTGQRGGKEIRSIVSFPMLLLYSLRIFLIQNKLCLYGEENTFDINVFNEKKLLKIFSPAVAQMKNDRAARSFLKLLWQVRIVFDKNIIKWVKEEGESEAVLTLRTLRISKDKRTGNLRVHRDSSNGNTITEMTQLQSLLYFSQPRIYEHWICPFLFHSFSENDADDLLKYLQQLDNVLLCLGSNLDMLKRTYNVMINGLGNYSGNDFSDYFNRLAEQEDGCKFAHYIFYKMEYILWWKNKQTKKFPYWDSYRLSSKNSVEHINPQTPKYNKKQISYLNTFGNLVLVSREVNSSYSNKSFEEKKAQFKAKRDEGHQLDSLKSDVIYSTDVNEWNDKECEQHLCHMKSLAEEYFAATAENYRKISDESNVIRKWVCKEYSENTIQLLAKAFAYSMKDEILCDAGSGYQRLPNENEIYKLPFIQKLFKDKRSVPEIIEGIDAVEYTHPENYYFSLHPSMINYIMRGKYYSDNNGRIVLVKGQRIGNYNYKEVLLWILECHLEKRSYEVTHWGDKVYLYIYFDGLKFTLDQKEEYILLKFWYNYQQCSMCYEIEVVGDNGHKGRRTRLLRANSWEFNESKPIKNLYIDNRPVLHHFRNNDDFEYIAMKCEQDIIEIVNRILKYE